MSIYVPAYYPSDSSPTSTTTGSNFISGLPDVFANGGTPVTVIVNGTASEPDATYNPILADHVAAIQAKGNQVLGYVDWKPKTADCTQTQPLHDCHGRWESDLPMPCTGACIAQYTSMYRWSHAPDGGGVLQSYALSGYFVDDAQRDDIGDLVYSELLGASGPRIVQLQAGITLFNPGTTVARRNAAGVFVTNQSGWSAPPDPTLFARQYNDGNTLSYQFQNETSDTPRCFGACDSNLCATCTCPGPVGIDAQVTFDSGSEVCATINITNYTGARINGWAASVQVDDAILTQTAGAAFAGSTHVLVASSSAPVDPGQTDSSASFCAARQTPGTGIAGIVAIGSP